VDLKLDSTWRSTGRKECATSVSRQRWNR
jgi:hypothetical protein